MKKDIKADILASAHQLFTENGYKNVSMRQIADALGISVGNLTYHFKKKEELIEALIQQTHARHEMPDVPSTLQELNELFVHIQARMQENAHYFWHFTQVAELSSGTREIQTHVVQEQTAMLMQVLCNLHEAGLALPEEYDGQHELVAQAVLLVCLYWVPQARLKGNDKIDDGYLDCVWSILFPLLTQEGKTIYLRTIKQSHDTGSKSKQTTLLG